jgi:hypothetical protein
MYNIYESEGRIIMVVKKIKAVTFKDTFKWDSDTRENIPYPATEQLEEFLNSHFLFLNEEIVSINYSVTHEGYNGAGIAQYCNHILLAYKD